MTLLSGKSQKVHLHFHPMVGSWDRDSMLVLQLDPLGIRPAGRLMPAILYHKSRTPENGHPFSRNSLLASFWQSTSLFSHALHVGTCT